MPLTCKKAGRSGRYYGQRKLFQSSAQQQSWQFWQHKLEELLRKVPVTVDTIKQFLRREILSEGDHAVFQDLVKQCADASNVLDSFPVPTRQEQWRSLRRSVAASFKTLQNEAHFGAKQSVTDSPLPVEHSGVERGRCNEVVVAPDILRNMLRMKLTRKEIGHRLGIAQATLRKVIAKHELATAVDDEQVHAEISKLLARQPERGSVMLEGHLRAAQPTWRVPREQLRRVYAACRTPEEMEARKRKVRFTSRYVNPLANSVWHIDTHCKLSFAGLYVHAAVDGHSKMTVYACASPNNSSAWALRGFQVGCRNFGVPSALRTDHGSENVLLTEAITEHEGIHMQGPSTSNVPIERRWGDLHAASVLREELHSMVSAKLISLHPELPWHQRCSLWLIYGHFMQRQLNCDMDLWSFHPCSTLSKNRTPYAAYVDSMYRQTHDPAYLRADFPAHSAMFNSQAFDLGSLADIFPVTDRASRAKVQVCLHDQERMDRIRAILDCARNRDITIDTLSSLRTLFRLVWQLLDAASQ